MAILHIAFGLSAAASMRQALAKDYPDHRVIAFTDDLSFGPIDLPDPKRCADWIAEELHFEWWDQVATLETNFWDVVTAWQGERVAWFSRRSSSEHANFLAFSARLGEQPFRVLDLTDTPLPFGSSSGRETQLLPACAVSVIPTHVMLSHSLAEKSVAPSAASRRADLLRWKQLQSENSALRMVRENRLVSAPITAFDHVLLSFCTAEWMKMARPVGHALESLMQNGTHQVGDLVLASRMFALLETGVLEGRGEMSSMRDTEVRLMQPSDSISD